MSEPRYADPQALRQALTDRLRRLTRERPGLLLQDLQRQFAYDRLLYRIFTYDPDLWLLKGATAMLARLGGVGRHTRDVDLYRGSSDLTQAEAALRECAALDVADWFHFTVSPGRIIESQGARARRIPVVAYLGATSFATFHVDLVTDLIVTGIPDTVQPLVPVELPGVARVPYRAYPIVDHIADKLCALVETHTSPSGSVQGSSRYRDLADIVTFAHTVDVAAAPLATAIGSEANRRTLVLPDRLGLQEFGDWRAGYARVARDVPGLIERDVEAALAIAARFLDPILAGSASGSWDRVSLSWR